MVDIGMGIAWDGVGAGKSDDGLVGGGGIRLGGNGRRFWAVLLVGCGMVAVWPPVGMVAIFGTKPNLPSTKPDQTHQTNHTI